MNHIMALLDASVYAQSVTELSAWAAKRLALPVDLVHVLPPHGKQSNHSDFSGSLNLGARSALLKELAELDERKAKLEMDCAWAIVDDAKAWMSEQGVAEVHNKLRHGGLVDTVQALEPEAEFIIIGKRGDAADFAKLHLGSNLERVVRAAQKPVLVAARAFKPIESFLIAYDGGDSANKAVSYVCDSPLFKGLTCHLVTVGQPNASVQAQWEQAQEQLKTAGFDVHAEVREGNPDQAIREKIEAANIDLLLMGAYGHTRIRNLIIGSTTTEMVRSCGVPVMLFR